MSLIFRVLVFLIFVTSSFDIFLNVNLGGFSFSSIPIFIRVLPEFGFWGCFIF